MQLLTVGNAAALVNQGSSQSVYWRFLPPEADKLRYAPTCLLWQPFHGAKSAVVRNALWHQTRCGTGFQPVYETCVVPVCNRCLPRSAEPKNDPERTPPTVLKSTNVNTRSISLVWYLPVLALLTGCDPDAGQGQRSITTDNNRNTTTDRLPPKNDRMTPARNTGPARSAVVPQERILGLSVNGEPIEALIYGDGADCVLILATIHGDEDAGTPLVWELSKQLVDRPEFWAGRRVVLMPLTNPDGMAAQTRGNVNGVDLNRNYPAQNFQPSPKHGPAPLSEPESKAIDRALREYRPNRIVSIHQPLRYGSECVDYDGPAEDLAIAMARHAPIPVRKIGSRPGSLGSYAGVTLRIPIITLELPKDAKGLDAATLWDDYGQMLLAAISFPESPVVNAGGR